MSINEEAINEKLGNLKSGQSEIKQTIEKIWTHLAQQGDVRKDFEEHKSNHKWVTGLVIAITTTLASVGGWLLSIASKTGAK